MSTIGAKLRGLRCRLGLSLRDVRDQSIQIARQCGLDSYEISGSWLGRVERGKHDLTVPKFLAISRIYNQPPDKLLKELHPELHAATYYDLPTPNNTVLVEGGGLEEYTKQIAPDELVTETIPDPTTLLSTCQSESIVRYRRAMIGKKDLSLSPMVKPGSILVFDTQRRAIAPRSEWSTEYDRPIYLLFTRDGYCCGWCDLDSTGNWLSLSHHPLSPQPPQQWRYKKEVEVLGRAELVVRRVSA